MSFLAPLFLALLALALPILVLYMLKLRRREVEVSSTLLWQMLLRDREANAPWQRLRRNLLLFLQLLLLAALVLALARPFWPVPTIATGTLVVLLDGSASMNAVDAPGSGSRFETARAAVRQLIDGLGPDGSMSLILVGQQPAVLVPTTSSKEALREGLAQAQPAESPADWEAAVALAAGAVRAGQADDSIIVIISDGGLPENLPPLPTEVRYVPIGTSADNLAIEALALRPAAGGPQLFASVANYGPAERTVIISFYVDGQLFSAQQVPVPPGGTAPVVLQALPAQAAVYEARLSLPAGVDAAALDALPLDDRAFAVYQPPSAGRVLLVTSGNIFLEQVFAALSGSLGLSPFRLQPGQPLPAEPFDLYVFDGVITGTLPAGADLLLVDPPANDYFEVGGTYSNTTPVRVVADPLTQFVDWSAVNLLQARDVALPTWARPLVQTDEGPLVFAGETGGRRIAVLAFDLHDSDLPLQVTFPVLMANLLGYLAPAQPIAAGDGLRPGETLVIKPRGGDTVVAITDPAGQEFAATATEAGVLFAQTHRLGLYTARSNQGVLGRFAVNLFNPAESDIAPAPTITIGRSPIAPAPREAQGEWEIWPWLALAAFALLLVEWWVYHRGNVLPSLPLGRKAIGGQ